MHGAIRCFDKVFGLVKEVLKEICVDLRISSSWQDNGEKEEHSRKRRQHVPRTYTAREHDEDKGHGTIFLKPTCFKNKEQPRWKIRPERRSRPHLAGHVLGSGDRDENKNIFTGHVEIFCRNNLCIVKITLATLGGKWPDGWMSWRLLQAATWEVETRTWGVASWSLHPPTPHPPACYSQACCHTRDL